VAELKEIICQQTSLLASSRFADRLRALVLTGSLARNEATFVEEQGQWKLLGDVDVYLIVDRRAALPSQTALRSLQEEIEGHLLDRGIACPIGLGAVHPSYFRGLRPSIYSYELRTCGRVVWGEPDLLSLIPPFSSSDIPLEDAWRLLSNRMVEMLEITGEVADRPDVLPTRVYYRTLKLYLDTATSFLVFAGAYEPTYRRRAERLVELAQSDQWKDKSPFLLSRFAERIRACTEIKLNARDQRDLPSAPASPAPGYTFWEEAVEYARLLWQWELSQLTAASSQTSNRELMERWMRLQPFPQRLRGWLYVLRKLGWYRSFGNWPRWARRAWKASPRYWVYATAGELFLRLPCLLRTENGPPVDLNEEELASWLPAENGFERDRTVPRWRECAANIAWNYKQFLVDTRS